MFSISLHFNNFMLLLELNIVVRVKFLSEWRGSHPDLISIRNCQTFKLNIFCILLLRWVIFRFLLYIFGFLLWSGYKERGKHLTIQCDRQLPDILVAHFCINIWVNGCKIRLKGPSGMVLLIASLLTEKQIIRILVSNSLSTHQACINLLMTEV